VCLCCLVRSSGNVPRCDCIGRERAGGDGGSCGPLRRSSASQAAESCRVPGGHDHRPRTRHPGWPASTTNGHRRTAGHPSFRFARVDGQDGLDATSSAPSTSTPARQCVSRHARAPSAREHLTEHGREVTASQSTRASTFHDSPHVSARTTTHPSTDARPPPPAIAPHHTLPLHAALIAERQNALAQNDRRRLGAILRSLRGQRARCRWRRWQGIRWSAQQKDRPEDGKWSPATRGFAVASGSAPRSTAGSCCSSRASAMNASARAPAPPAERQPAALAGHRGSGCQQAHRRLSQPRQSVRQLWRRRTIVISATRSSAPGRPAEQSNRARRLLTDGC
jgi:hypothetical protein